MHAKRIRLLCVAFFLWEALLALLLVALPARLFMLPVDARALNQVSPQIDREAGRKPELTPRCGKIEPVEMSFGNPDGVFPDQDRRLGETKWFFEGHSRRGLSQFLNSCALQPLERKLLLDKSSWNVVSNGIVLRPAEQLVLALNPHGRQQIYSVLAKSSTNYPQCFPFRFPLDGFDRRFEHSGIAPADLEKIRRLTYTNAGDLCLADLQAAKSMLKPGEFNNLVETLFTMPAYLLRVHLSPESDIDAMIQYWGRGGRQKFIAPLLRSMAKLPGGASINISYLLPPFARLRLYTFPEAWDDLTIIKQDCVFTALNFFNETPDTNLFDLTYREKFLNSRYVRINDEPSLGDMVTLLNPENEVFHACVYIAEGFVFTKNGVSPAQPWVLMKMSEMLTMYSAFEKSSRVVFLRRKDLG